MLETPIYGYGDDCILDVNVMFRIGVVYYFITSENRHHQRRFLNLKCVQMRWRPGLCLDSAGIAYSAFTDPLAGFGGDGMGLGTVLELT